MKRHELENASVIQALDHASIDMPHATLETNHTCNLHCTFCYNEDRRNVKSLELLLAELEALQQHRPHLHTVTLLGGEPLLHPNLCALVRAVRRAGRLCQVMTNGIAFLEKDGHTLLQALQTAGVSRFALHVDEGQGDAATIQRRRMALYRLMEERRIHFSLTITLAESTCGIVSDLVKEGAAFRYFDGILAFMATDQEKPLQPARRLPAEHANIRAALKVSASAYVPSNLDHNEIRWLLYHIIIDHRSGNVLDISPRYNQLFTRLFHKATNRNPFMLQIPPIIAGMGSLFTWLVESLLQPRQIRSSLRKIGGFVNLYRSRFFFIAIGVPPEVGAEDHVVEFCYHCPDATMRNGEFMPVCIADRISPLTTPRNITPRFQSVLQHLQDRA